MTATPLREIMLVDKVPLADENRLLFLRHCGICCHRPGDRGRAELQGCEAMRETIIMRGAYAITDARLGASGVIAAGAVVIVDGTIRETGPFAAIAPRYPGIGGKVVVEGSLAAHHRR